MTEVVASSEKISTTPPKTKRKWIIWASIISAVVIAILFYWYYATIYPSTDDAYVQANVVYMAPQVSGPISAIYVENNEVVKKGQKLFDIDPAPFIIAINQAKANLAQAEQTMLSNIQAVNVAQALINQRQSELVTANEDAARTFILVKQGWMSPEAGDDALNSVNVAKANLASAQSQLKQAQAQLGEPGQRNAGVRVAKAQLAQAILNLQYTHVVAPSNAKLINFDLRTGTLVQTNQQLFQMIEEDQWWVNGNYRETDLKRIRVGQPAKIKIDMYPGIEFKGYVQSISSGSGAEFSLLPPENATGNWVKVTQRFPVKIMITDSDLSTHPLRMGSSSTVVVDTR